MTNSYLYNLLKEFKIEIKIWLQFSTDTSFLLKKVMDLISQMFVFVQRLYKVPFHSSQTPTFFYCLKLYPVFNLHLSSKAGITC